MSALREADAFRPNVVLLDIGMPGLDGHEVARRLRASEATKDCRLIAISGWGTPEDRKRSYDAGFDHHLVKPFDLGVLDSLLRSFGAGLAKDSRALRGRRGGGERRANPALVAAQKPLGASPPVAIGRPRGPPLRGRYVLSYLAVGVRK